MSSITSTIQSVLDRTGYGAYASNGIVGRATDALIRREEEIAEQIVGEVVRQFGVPEGTVRTRLAETGLAVIGAGIEDESEIEDDEDEDEVEDISYKFDEPSPAEDAAFQPAPEQDGVADEDRGDDLAEAVTALIRAITARIA